MKKKHMTKKEREAIYLDQAQSKIPRLEVCKSMKGRVKAVTTSENRSTRRMLSKMSGRCNNYGIPSNEAVNNEKFKVLRNNRKVAKVVRTIIDNNIGYSRKVLTEASKTLKSKKASEEEKSIAEKLIERVGKYKGLVCIEDQFNKLQKVGA